jgi:hypothetical protein
VWSGEVSGDLQIWNPAVIVTNNASTFTARDTIAKNSAYRRMIRLRVEKP